MATDTNPAAPARPTGAGPGTRPAVPAQREPSEPRTRSRRPHVVIAVVNLPAEKDRRVIRETLALEAAGYRVTIICPRGPRNLSHLPGSRDARLRTFRQPFAGSGVVSFAVEFAWSFLCVGWHLLRLVVSGRVAGAQVCNPPDAFWPLALPMRALGKVWVFDHHDLSPELYECKTDQPNPTVLRILRWFERRSMRWATHVFSTNNSYRDIALGRGGLRPDQVTVVRNGPTLAEVGTAESDVDSRTEVKRIAYVGVLGPQDRVDIAIDAARLLVDLRGRTGWELVIAGDGECLDALRQQATDLGLTDVVRFAGWLEATEVDQLLRGATLGIQPDPPTTMADLSTMAKTVEYLARGVPVVAASLQETRYSAGEAGAYVPTGTADEYAKVIDQLLDDDSTLATMRSAAHERFRTVLAWEHQARAYVGAWNAMVPVPVR